MLDDTDGNGTTEPQRFLHGGVTPKPVEERFATLEKELRDVHGLVLGDASNAADSTGPNSPGTLEAWAAAAGSLAAGLIKGTVSMTSSEAEHTETPTTMRKGEVGKAVSYGGRSEWGTGTEETEATSRTREATRAHTSKNTSRAANRSQGKTGSPPESPKRPHTGRAGGTVNGDGETETAQQENKGHELGESKRSGREAKFDLPVEELAAQHHFDTKPSSKVASKHTSKAPSAAPSRPETIRGRRPDDGTDVSVQSDATKVSSKAPSKATSKAVSKGVSQNGSNNNSPRQAKTPGRRMENGNWSESDHYGEKSEASTRQQDLFGGYSEVEASSDGEESEFKDAEEQSETRQVDGSSSPRGGYPKTPGSASEKKSVHSSEGGKRSERSQITNRRFEEGSETDVSTRGPTDELQKVGFDEDFDGKQ